MRLEALEKEADLYRGHGECYIHVERSGKTPYTCIMAGDRGAVAQTVYNIMFEVSEQLEVSFPELLKMYKQAYKKFGVAKRSVEVDD